MGQKGCLAGCSPPKASLGWEEPGAHLCDKETWKKRNKNKKTKQFLNSLNSLKTVKIPSRMFEYQTQISEALMPRVSCVCGFCLFLPICLYLCAGRWTAAAATAAAAGAATGFRLLRLAKVDKGGVPSISRDDLLPDVRRVQRDDRSWGSDWSSHSVLGL